VGKEKRDNGRIDRFSKGLLQGRPFLFNNWPLLPGKGNRHLMYFASMRVTDRLLKYLEYKELSVYAFEKACGLANGYLKKQQKGKGSIGSDILEKINHHYADLDLLWIITGKGTMLLQGDQVIENKQPVLREKRQDEEQIVLLKAALADKEKIIRLLEQQLTQVKLK